METEAFMIVEIHGESDEILVRGRAYIDIVVGDSLYANNSDKDCIHCIIEKMSSYGRETTILSSMMTGDVILKLPQDTSLKGCQMLYKSI